jgi:hypothetical protein
MNLNKTASQSQQFTLHAVFCCEIIAGVAVGTGGLGSGISGAMMTAAATSASTTATISATNASMNTDSNFLNSTNSIADNSWKATTSDESLQNIAISAITAGAVYGASAYLSGASASASASTEIGNSASANTSTTASATTTSIYVNPTLSNSTILTSNALNNSSSFLTNLGNASIKVATATTANILATSAIKQQSIDEVIAKQGGVDRVILSSALQVAGEVGAKAIGNLAHGSLAQNADGSLAKNLDGTITYNAPAISQTQQLTLHAILGCAIGAGMSGGGSGCASGAAAGVVGELTANSMYQEGRTNLDGTPIGFSRNTSIAMGGLSGSLASAFTSIALGDDDSKVAKNIYAGSFVGTNAGANNATFFKNRKISNYPNHKDYDLNVGFQYSAGPVTVNYGTDGVGATGNAIPSLGISGYINFIPRGEIINIGLSLGIKDTMTLDSFYTDKGNLGLGATGGFSIAPPVLINTSVDLGFSDQSNLKK